MDPQEAVASSFGYMPSSMRCAARFMASDETFFLRHVTGRHAAWKPAATKSAAVWHRPAGTTSVTNWRFKILLADRLVGTQSRASS